LLIKLNIFHKILISNGSRRTYEGGILARYNRTRRRDLFRFVTSLVKSFI
ncbi:hypothetical protein L9F63_006747, partial [Diploptera punctata]